MPTAALREGGVALVVVTTDVDGVVVDVEAVAKTRALIATAVTNASTRMNVNT